jgi:hypothetical protein
MCTSTWLYLNIRAERLLNNLNSETKIRHYKSYLFHRLTCIAPCRSGWKNLNFGRSSCFILQNRANGKQKNYTTIVLETSVILTAQIFNHEVWGRRFLRNVGMFCILRSMHPVVCHIKDIYNKGSLTQQYFWRNNKIDTNVSTLLFIFVAHATCFDPYC